MNALAVFLQISSLNKTNLLIIHQPWLKRMQNCYSKANYPLCMILLVVKSITQALVFRIFFKILFLYCSCLKNCQTRSPKKLNQMLILAIFGLFDPFEYVIKIIIKVAQCIYAGSMGLHPCISFGGECSYMWHRSVKKFERKSVETLF